MWRGTLLRALLCSIIINVAGASYIAVQALGPFSWFGVHAEREEGNPEEIIGRFAARLPSQDATVLWQVYHTKEQQILAAIDTTQSARSRALAALSRPDLDTSALQAAFREAMNSRMQEGELLIETVVETLKRISPEGRMQLVKQINDSRKSR
jgi:uncharacterized membrane protein